jgi:hypothetical protein
MLRHIAPEMRGKGALSRTALAGRKNHDIHANSPVLIRPSIVAQVWLTERYRLAAKRPHQGVITDLRLRAAGPRLRKSGGSSTRVSAAQGG